MLVDTHTHLNFPDYDKDREGIIKRALDAGIDWMIVVGTDLRTSQQALDLAQNYDKIYAALGVHPHDAKNFDEESLGKFRKLCQHPKTVAVGEIGLDFYRDLSPRETQKEVFRRFIRLAKEVRLPIVLHIREAYDEVLSILEEEKAEEVGGVFHCFSGDVTIAEAAMEKGFYISFTGVITFKNSKAVKVLESLPVERLLLETDCPYLTPEPYRGRRNEPAYLRYIAEKTAQVKGLSLQEVGWVTSRNAEELFKKVGPQQ